MSKLSYKTLFIIFFFLLIGVIVLSKFVLPNQKVSAAWWNDMWNYRKAISIGNTSGSTLTNQRVKIIIDTAALVTAGKLQSDCDDIRITDINGNLLDHWDTGCNTSTTNIYFKTSSLSTSGSTIYFYYGNPLANNIEKPLGTSENPGTSCKMMKDQGSVTVNGTYYIVPGGADIDKQFVYCDQTTDGGGWTLIMNQKSNTGGFFTNSTQAQSYNESNPIADRYSILGKLAKFKDSGIFTFKINWPALGSTRNIWSQTSNPISENIAGYTGITIDQTVNSWGGIAPSSTASTFIDGSPGASTWYYAVASYISYNGGIPHYGEPATNQTQLWVKGNDTMNNVSIGTPLTEETSIAPIAYWKFDEGVGTTAYDSTSNRNNGTISGASWQTEDQCVSGKCLYFNRSSYINIVNNNSINLTNNFTINIWVKGFTPSGAWDVIIAKENWNANSGWFMYVENGNLYFNTNSSNRISITNPLSDNKWHLISVSISSGNTILYVDGKNKGSANTPITANSGNLYIGSRHANDGSGNTDYIKTFIDDVKVYPYARTAAQIKLDYNAGKAHAGTSEGTSTSLGSNTKNSEAFSDGLVGYWKMDEGTGTSILDSSGLGITGTTTGSPTWTSGKYGIGLTFDGGTSYVNLGDNSNYDFGANNFSVSAWVYRNSGFGSYDTGAITKWNTGGAPGTNEWSLAHGGIANGSDKYPGFGVEIGSTSYNTISSETTNDNQWYFLTGIRNGDYIEIYVDGVLKKSTYIGSGPINNISGRTLKIAKIDGGAYGLNGKIDEVRIYNRALSPIEVSQLYEYAPGPVGYWDFEENTGTIARDKSGNNNNGTLNNGPIWTQGKIGSGINFDGSNDFMKINQSSSINSLTQFNIGFWIKHDGSNVDNYILYKGSSAISFAVNISGNNLLLSYWTTAGSRTNLSSISVPPNEWHYIAFTFKVNDVSNTYLDGKLMLTTAVSTIRTSAEDLYFNTYDGSTGSYNVKGIFDDVKIYNYVRTQKQIIEDMSGGASATSTKSMLAYYKFDEGQGTIVNNWGNGGVGLSGAFGAGSYAPTWTNNGKFNKGLSFDGTDDFIKIPQSSAINSLTEFTFSFWINHDGSNSDKYILYKGSASPSFTVNFGSNNIGQEYWTTAGARTTATVINNISPNQWHHIVFTFKTNAIAKSYLDGKLISTNSTIGTIRTNTEDLYFNTYGGTVGSYNVKGLFDDLKIYNYALTDEEVKQDYNQGSAIQMGASKQTIGTTTTSLEYCIPGDTTYCASPVAEWNFEENTGTSAKDTSGNNNNGTFGTGNSAPTWSIGKIGAGLRFDGVNDRLTLTSTINLVDTNNWTVSAWVKTGTANNSILSNSSGGPVANDLRIASSKISYAHYSGAWLYESGTSNIANNQWHYLTWVNYSNKSMDMYVDGVKEGIGVSSAQSTGPVNQIGGNWYGTANAIIDQFRIYNYARTPAQIAYDYNKGGPVGWWQLDECQGNIAQDWSGIGNTGTIVIGASGTQNSLGTCQVGTSAAWTNGAIGKINSSLNFDGVDDYIEISDNPSLKLPDIYSFSVWIKPTTVSNWKTILEKGTVGARYMFWLNGSEISAIGHKESPYTTTTNANLIAGQWAHLIFTFDYNSSPQAKIYKNGILLNSTNTTGIGHIPNTGSSSLRIGDDPGNQNYYFQGQLDDVRIYNYALTSEQVKILYNGGSVSFN